MTGSLLLCEQRILNYVNFLARILLTSDWFKHDQPLSQLTHAHCRDSPFKGSADRRSLSVKKVKEAEKEIIKQRHRISDPKVIQVLQRMGSFMRQATRELKNLKITGHIRKLHPLLDQMGILRVGGRLENALIE